MLLGNHHDAWVFGAVDPLSGSAALTEITRVFGLMLGKGMRSAPFCNNHIVTRSHERGLKSIFIAFEILAQLESTHNSV